MNGLAPLTADEAALCYHVMRFGSDGYPVGKLGRRWIVRDFLSVKGAPVVYKTKRAAVAAFEAWHELALERWAEMKRANPNLIMTAVGITDLGKAA